MKNNANIVVIDRMDWFAPNIIRLDIPQTQGKRRVRDFEGGNNPNNPCINMSNPNYDPTLNRCFRRGPS